MAGPRTAQPKEYAMIKPIAGLVAGIALLWGTQAFAGTYIVNSESDAPDAVPGDGICDILPPGDPTPPVCTLRAAIAQANAQPDASTVYIPAGFHIVLLGP